MSSPESDIIVGTTFSGDGARPTRTSITEQPIEMVLAAMEHGDPRAADEFVRRVVEHARENGAIPEDAVVTYGFAPDPEVAAVDEYEREEEES